MVFMDQRVREILAADFPEVALEDVDLSYQMLVGTSMSFCVRDILDEKVPIESVARLWTTCYFDWDKPADDPGSVHALIERYSEVYWKGHTPERVLAVLQKLRPRTVLNRQWIEDEAWLKSFDERQQVFRGTLAQGWSTAHDTCWVLDDPDMVQVIHRGRMYFVCTPVRVK